MSRKCPAETKLLGVRGRLERPRSQASYNQPLICWQTAVVEMP